MPDYCDALNQIEAKLHQDHKEVPFRIVVIKNGQLIAEWNNRLNAEIGLRVNSVKKSIIALALGIAVADGTIQSIDDRVYDYASWIIDVEEGEGPKPTVYATEKDREITFRQIVSHFSGYMKVDEPPGEKFHYQTYSVNMLANVIASLYGRYDPVAHWLSGNQGIGSLIGEWIREEIGANWDWRYGAFAGINQSDKLGIFGNNNYVYTNARDLARLGWLLVARGNWFGRQIIPADWISECTNVSALLKERYPESQWVYGQLFWVNCGGNLWPSLPHDSFAMFGQGGHMVCASQSAELVVAGCPLPGEGPNQRFFEEYGVYNSRNMIQASVVPSVFEALGTRWDYRC